MDYNNSTVSYIGKMWAMVASLGWYMVAVIFALWYASPYIQDKYSQWKTKKDEQEYATKYHKDTDLLQQRLSGLEASRQKMQEMYNKNAVIAQEKQEELMISKMQERSKLIEKINTGHVLGSSKNDTASTSRGPKSKSLKPEYNPLMGDSSRGYRPPKRSCCGKGGCN